MFRSAQRLLRQAGSWNDVDALALEVWVLALSNARACRVAAEACPIVQGKDGPRAHPGLHAAAHAEERAIALADALLLSPAARQRAAAKPTRRGTVHGPRLEAV